MSQVGDDHPRSRGFELLAELEARMARADKTDRISAALAAVTPAAESSTTMQSAGCTPIRAAACKNRSGAGLPFGTSLAEKTNLKNLAKPVVSRLARIRSGGEDDATHFGPRSQVSA